MDKIPKNTFFLRRKSLRKAVLIKLSYTTLGVRYRTFSYPDYYHSCICWKMVALYQLNPQNKWYIYSRYQNLFQSRGFFLAWIFLVSITGFRISARGGVRGTAYLVTLSRLQLDLQLQKVVWCAVSLDHVDPRHRSHREQGQSDQQLRKLLLSSL